MKRYKIRIETEYSLYYLRKEYYSYPQAQKAVRMLNKEKLGYCVIRIAEYVNDVRTRFMD